MLSFKVVVLHQLVVYCLVMLPQHIAVARKPTNKEKTKRDSGRNAKNSDDYKKKNGYGTSSSHTNEDYKKKLKDAGYKQKSSAASSNEKEKQSKEKNENSSNPVDPNATGSNSKDKYPYGNKKYSKSGDPSSKSTTNNGDFTIPCNLDKDLWLEEVFKRKEMEKSSTWSLYFWFAVLFGISCFGLYLLIRYNTFQSRDEIRFAEIFTSVTHHKLVVLSDDYITSHNIRTLLMDVGSVFNYQREAAIYFVYQFRREVTNNHTTGYPVTLHTSLLAYGFQVYGKMTDIQPSIVHNQEVTEWGPGGDEAPNDAGFQMGESLIFPRLDSSSMFSKYFEFKIYLPIMNYCKAQIKDADDTIEKLIKSDSLFVWPLNDLLEYINTMVAYNRSEADPCVNIERESLVSYDHSSLQFSSSGTKTLGAIAEVAIHVALESLRNSEPYSAKQVDNAIAEALACTLQALERHPGYFENLLFNLSTILQDFRLRTDYFRNNKLNCLDKGSTAKLHTNGVLTSNILIMDNRDGWPTVFHYSVSTNGSSYLESSNGKKSHGLLNVCQVVVIKDGYLWLTAAASGEFYLLEKVVASIVHKIVMNTDPLGLIYSKTRKRYDVRSGTVVTGKYPSNVKEILQFSEYKVLQNKFRSWVETPDENSEFKRNVASGY